ncbi:MAG: DUF2470 domain-containing protein [Opitutales bacterium]
MAYPDFPHIFSEEQLQGMVGHMNDDHADSVLLYAQVYGGQAEATAARLLSVDAQGMDIDVDAPQASAQPVRVTFDTPLKDAHDAHITLVKLSKAARKKLAEA